MADELNELRALVLAMAERIHSQANQLSLNAKKNENAIESILQRLREVPMPMDAGTYFGGSHHCG